MKFLKQTINSLYLTFVPPALYTQLSSIIKINDHDPAEQSNGENNGKIIKGNSEKISQVVSQNHTEHFFLEYFTRVS